MGGTEDRGTVRSLQAPGKATRWKESHLTSTVILSSRPPLTGPALCPQPVQRFGGLLPARGQCRLYAKAHTQHITQRYPAPPAA